MAFGDLLGTLTANAASITNPTDAAGTVTVAVNDLIFGVIGEQTSLTSSGCTDNLGNSYTAQNAGTDAGTSTARAWYSIVTVAGSLTAVHFAATASSDNVAVFVACIGGPFQAIDVNIANITSDIASPFTCPSTGTLATDVEIIMSWGVATGSTVWAATAPTTLAGQAATAAILHTVIGYQIANTTSAVSPVFTAGSNPSDAVLGTCSFKRLILTRTGGHGRDNGLIGHWPLNEGAGRKAYDISGNLYHGTFGGTVPTYVTSDRFGKVLMLHGDAAADSHVDFGNIGDQSASTSFSFTFWAKLNASHFQGYQYNGVTSGVAGTTLNVTTLNGGTLAVGHTLLSLPSYTNACTITALGTGTGGTGTYTVSTNAAVGTSGIPVGWMSNYVQYEPLFAKQQGSGSLIGWEIYANLASGSFGGIKITDQLGNNTLVETTETFLTNKWFFLAGVCDRTAQLIKISVNGFPFHTTSSSSIGSLINNASVTAGFSTGQIGQVSDARYYNRAISLAEINQLYSQHKHFSPNTRNMPQGRPPKRRASIVINRRNTF